MNYYQFFVSVPSRLPRLVFGKGVKQTVSNNGGQCYNQVRTRLATALTMKRMLVEAQPAGDFMAAPGCSILMNVLHIHFELQVLGMKVAYCNSFN